MSHGRKRVFFALWPEADAAGHLAALGEAMAADHGGRAMIEPSLHLTLEFLGSADPAQVELLCAAASRVRAPALEVRLDRLGFWATQGILWAGCRTAPKALLRLHEDLEAQLAWAGITPEPKPFVPHVTLTRRSRCRAVPRLETPVSWRADSFALAESLPGTAEARYRILASWPLDLSVEPS